MPLFKALSSPFHFLQQAFTACEDCWTWTTVHGEMYEDVLLLDLTRDTATIQHRYGVDTILRADLDRETQQSLIDNSEMAEPDDLHEDDHFAHARPMSRAEHFSHAA